jgi:hypothetical protein
MGKETERERDLKVTPVGHMRPVQSKLDSLALNLQEAST